MLITLDTVVRTLSVDGWLVEVEHDQFAANKVTHAMTDPDFQSLVAHWSVSSILIGCTSA